MANVGKIKQIIGPVVDVSFEGEGMYVPDAQGFLRPTGRLVGGHCLFDRGVSKWMNDRPYNSWGLG